MVLFCLITAWHDQRFHPCCGHAHKNCWYVKVCAECEYTTTLMYTHSFKIKNKNCGAFTVSREWDPAWERWCVIEHGCGRYGREVETAALFLLQQSLQKLGLCVCEGAEERDWVSKWLIFHWSLKQFPSTVCAASVRQMRRAVMRQRNRGSSKHIVTKCRAEEVTEKYQLYFFKLFSFSKRILVPCAKTSRQEWWNSGSISSTAPSVKEFLKPINLTDSSIWALREF